MRVFGCFLLACLAIGAYGDALVDLEPLEERLLIDLLEARNRDLLEARNEEDLDADDANDDKRQDLLEKRRGGGSGPPNIQCNARNNGRNRTTPYPMNCTDNCQTCTLACENVASWTWTAQEDCPSYLEIYRPDVCKDQHGGVYLPIADIGQGVAGIGQALHFFVLQLVIDECNILACDDPLYTSEHLCLKTYVGGEKSLRISGGLVPLFLPFIKPCATTPLTTPTPTHPPPPAP
ncbi:uncharacterized protein [Amphiura filiformis]|uniref:uncharacterized protein n=1 Tax=Amphiura filiformis TaxID=82378 RepID=UPI003B222AF9